MTTCLAPNGPTVYRGEGAPTRLLVGTADGIVVLERASANAAWQPTGRMLEGRHISSLLFEPRRGGLFAGAHNGGLYASLDGGQTWARKMDGITQEHVFTLASTERDGQTVLYAGTEPAYLFESTDYGETWRELPALRNVPETEAWIFPAPPHDAHVKDVTFDPRDTRTMYVSIEQGALLKSTDAGQTFRELKEYSRPDDKVYRDLHRLVLRPSNPDQMYFTGGAGLYYSADGGERWEHLSDHTARIGYPDGLQFSPVDDQVLFMAGAHRDPGSWRQSHDANAALGRSRDGGRTWEILTTGWPGHMRGNAEALSMGVWPGGFALFVGTTDGDVFASEDAGDTWTRIAGDLAPISKGGHYLPLTAAAAR
jgi:photosystem II stability/assembly factor-like uncharacterized protein